MLQVNHKTFIYIYIYIYIYTYTHTLSPLIDLDLEVVVSFDLVDTPSPQSIFNFRANARMATEFYIQNIIS